jgi:phosphomannomutase
MNFGTSGLRGLADEMTDEVCASHVQAFLTYLGRRERPTELLVGRDLRPSSPRIAIACGAAAAGLGVRAIDCGVVPTPALALEAALRRSPAVMVTGSHTPFDRNGLKFYRADGEIGKDDEAGIIASLSSEPPRLVAPSFEPLEGVGERYVARYVEFFGPGRLSGMRVGVYLHSAAGRDLLVEVLRRLGADVVPLGRSDDFVPVDTEALDPATTALLRDWVVRNRLDALVSTDGDGDRPITVDERGHLLRGDTIGILAAHILGADAVAAPINVSTALDRSGWFPRVRRTRIGSPYVIAAMAGLAREGARLPVAFEANGGFLLGRQIATPQARLAALPTRDALLPICALLAEAADREIPLSRLLGALPERATASDRLRDVDPRVSATLIGELAGNPDMRSRFAETVAGAAVRRTDLLDGVQMELDSGDIIHLRASGNAPELRCYGESATPERAARLVDRALRRAGQLLTAPAAPR